MPDTWTCYENYSMDGQVSEHGETRCGERRLRHAAWLLDSWLQCAYGPSATLVVDITLDLYFRFRVLADRPALVDDPAPMHDSTTTIRKATR
jgi:hypothetical protein